MLFGKSFHAVTGLDPAGAPSSPCFYCGELVTVPFIQWIGESTITLHPECTVEFAIRLLRDVHEFECEEKRELLTPRSSSPAGRGQ